MALVHNPAPELGTPAPDFTLTNALDGAEVSLASVMGERGLLVAFICNHCPYVKAIITDLVSDAAQLAERGVNTVAIMPNDYARYPADAPDAMRAFAAQHGFGFPYLIDETQAVARAYGAVCTPDFFGYDASGALRYRGRLDDGGIDRKAERAAELLDAMTLVAESGQGPIEQHNSMGCSIKWR